MHVTKLEAESITKKFYFGALWKSFGFASISVQKKVLHAFAGSLMVFTAVGHPLLEDDHLDWFTTGRFAQVNPMDSVLAKIH